MLVSDQMINDLNLRIEDLPTRRVSDGAGAEKKAIAVDLGNLIEDRPQVKQYSVKAIGDTVISTDSKAEIMNLLAKHATNEEATYYVRKAAKMVIQKSQQSNREMPLAAST